MKTWIPGAVLGAVASGVLTAAYAWRIERAHVGLDRYTVTVDRPGLPPGGIAILHLSDFHFRGGGATQARKIARLKRLLVGEQHDVLALTGDLIHDAAGLPVALDLIDGLRPRLGAFSCPGNHDYAEYSVWGVFERTWRQGDPAARGRLADLVAAGRRLWAFARKVVRNELVRLPVALNDVPAMHGALAAHGVRPLVNRAVRVQAGGADFWMAGVDDLTEGSPDLKAALAEVPDDALLILLAHNPDIWLDPRVGAADLVLAGHTHGGQVRLPMVGAIHTQGTHLARTRPAGWFERKDTRMFVSRGVGESIPLRLGVRPQAALIRLLPGA